MDALSLFMILASSIPTGQLIAVIALAAACVAFGVTDIVLFATRNKAKDESLAESEASADAEEPAQEEPAQEEPAQEEPAQEEPAQEEPAQEEPAQEEPAQEEPAQEEPAQEEPVQEEPAQEEPAQEEPVQEEPVQEEPAQEEPVQEEPAQEEPVQEEPAQEDELVVAAVAETDDEEDEGEEEEDEDDDDFESDDDDIEDIFVDEPAADQTDENGVIIPVPLFPAEEKRRVYVRYIFSFRAKLIQAPPEIQQRYGELADEVNSYDRVKMSVSWKQVRIYAGRNTLAALLFKGRKLCMAFALDPKEYEDTKYRGKDLSEIKRFRKTPMLLKLTSPRKVRYAKHLFAEVAAKYGLEKGETVRTQFYLPYRTTEELVADKLVKEFMSGKAGENAEIVRADISEMIRSQVTLREAQSALSDEVAAELIEHETHGRLDDEDQPEPAVSRKGAKKGIVNIDTLSKNFEADDTVTLEALIEKGLVPKKVGSLKVLARGVLDKPLTVEAQDFSLDAVKMIVLTGGKAVKTL